MPVMPSTPCRAPRADASTSGASGNPKSEGYEIDYRSYDGTALPYKDEVFDLVCCFGTFHHVPVAQQKRLANQLSRVIAKGGYLLWAENSVRTTRRPGGERVGQHSFVIDDPTDPEHGMVQHLLTIKQCREFFPRLQFTISATEFLEGEGLELGTCLWNLCGRKKG